MMKRRGDRYEMLKSRGRAGYTAFMLRPLAATGSKQLQIEILKGKNKIGRAHV